MAKPYKFRHVNEIAGAFVLTVGALLVVAIVLMATSQGWFTPTQRVMLKLPKTGSLGLKPGADVQILGNVVGTVRAIQTDERDRDQLLAVISVKSEFMRFIRRRTTPEGQPSDGSEVNINRTLGFGDPYVEITKGTGPEFSPGEVPVLAVNEPGRGPTELVEGAVADIREAVVPAVKKAGEAFEEHRKFAAELRESNQTLRQAIGRIDVVAARVERGEGLAGKVLSDPALADQATAAVPKVNASIDDANAAINEIRAATAVLSEQSRQTMERMQAILADIQKTTAALPETAKAVGRTAEAMPGLVLQMQETMRQIQRLVEGMQRSFLVRGSVAPDDTGRRVRPEEVGSGGK